ncbi:hypothetical protein RchiOBHm_Chr4g0396301 [Rosa chinensis]|uniref:Uncharacterized protein n=1 Tax=Rosa chinensis TaxID=74649 RepID=A0A2P6QRT9_ROSCH|nr:hypothetical protein RchiOBHm_Chr4g0396301 [Rosa chinensis]
MIVCICCEHVYGYFTVTRDLFFLHLLLFWGCYSIDWFDLGIGVPLMFFHE